MGELYQRPECLKESLGVRVRKFTWMELSQLNRHENAHIAYRGRVYDISKFVASHPGGAEQILLGAGKDIALTLKSCHSPNVVKILEKYYVGDLIDSEFPTFPEMGEFYKTLKQHVHNHFKSISADPKIDYWVFMRWTLPSY